MKKSKWESIGVFNAIIIFTSLFIFFQCAPTSKQIRGSSSSSRNKKIISFRLVNSIGPKLADNKSLIEPTGITTNDVGDIFISDKYHHTVFRLDQDLKFISREGGIGVALGGFNSPEGMACDAALNLYVADSDNKRLQTLDRNLRYADVIEKYYIENKESKRFVNPIDIAVDNEGNIWVADDDKLLKLSPFYDLLHEISYDAPGRYDIGKISSIAISDNDLLAAADPENERIVVFTSYGRDIFEIESGPVKSIAWDRDNLIWAVNDVGDRITAYTVYGTVEHVWAESSLGSVARAVTIDSNNHLVIIDQGLRKVLLYEIIYGNEPKPDQPNIR